MAKHVTPLSEIAVPAGLTAEEADFYRAGFRDGELGKNPARLEGRAPALQLAYATGGMEGALSARRALAESRKPKIHTRIGHERSLCGLAPKNGLYQIVSNREFALAKATDQCAVCAERFQRRGYNLNKLRERFEAEDAAARQRTLASVV